MHRSDKTGYALIAKRPRKAREMLNATSVRRTGYSHFRLTSFSHFLFYKKGSFCAKCQTNFAKYCTERKKIVRNGRSVRRGYFVQLLYSRHFTKWPQNAKHNKCAAGLRELSLKIYKRATRYLRTTKKHGWSESFAEKIISSQNTIKTTHATHYSLILQSLMLASTSSVCAKNPFEFIIKTARLVKQDKLSFTKECFAKCYETPSAHYLWCVPISLFRPSFVVVRE